MIGSILLAVSALFLGGTTFGTSTNAGLRLLSRCTATSDYTSWPSIKHAFIFGDSYTTTRFNVTGIQPSIGNPLGNPAFPGITTSNGPNWVDFLTVKYNESMIFTYNLAFAGATVDTALVATAFLKNILSVAQQVENEFFPTYASSPAIAPWTSSDTLFGVFIGINDVDNSYESGAASTKVLNNEIFAVYEGLIEMLYNVGARNFLFLNVPPVDRSPLTSAQGAASQALEKADIKAFNDKIGDMANQLKGTHSDTNIFTFDANGLFTTVLDNPRLFTQTAGYKNMTKFCVAYENGTSTENYFDPTCGVPVNEYFWLNTLHPTYPMHDVLGQEVAKALEAGPNVC